MERPYYVTTPIYYISGNPHVGHVYTTVVADVLARTARTFRPTFFLTGTDEHGQKVANAAAAAGKSPQEWCDELVPRWKELFAAYHVEYDDFIRTTETRHVEKVQRVFELQDRRCTSRAGISFRLMPPRGTNPVGKFDQRLRCCSSSNANNTAGAVSDPASKGIRSRRLRFGRSQSPALPRPQKAK